jgi:preprotein translocase subunit SecG
MAILINIIHVAVCLGLIVVILLQADKGEGLAGAFGGGASSTIFGERGGGGFMSKLTTTMAIVFMITSLIISVFVPRWEKASPKINYQIPMSAPVQDVNPMNMMGLPMGGGTIVTEESADMPADSPAPVQESAPIDRNDPPVRDSE